MNFSVFFLALPRDLYSSPTCTYCDIIGIHLCTCNAGLSKIHVQLRMKEVAFCLAKEHDTVTPAGAQTWIVQSSVQHTNRKGTALPTHVHILLK